MIESHGNAPLAHFVGQSIWLDGSEDDVISSDTLRSLFRERIAPDALTSRFLTTELCRGLEDRMAPRTSRFHYLAMNEMISTRQVLREMRRLRVRPALFSELVRLYRAHPIHCTYNSIVALGSATDESGEMRAPYLCRPDEEWTQIMDLTPYLQEKWPKVVRFLVASVSGRSE